MKSDMGRKSNMRNIIQNFHVIQFSVRYGFIHGIHTYDLLCKFYIDTTYEICTNKNRLPILN